jgi:hypothetical protein
LPQTDPALLLIQGPDGQTQGTAFAAPSAGIDQQTYSGKYADAHSPHPNLHTDCRHEITLLSLLTKTLIGKNIELSARYTDHFARQRTKII